MRYLQSLKNAMVEPAHQFRLYSSLSRTGLHVRVNVWRTRAEMLMHYRETVPRRQRKRCQMFTVSGAQEYRNTRRLVPMFAEINLSLSYTCVGAVSHEVVHAVAALFRRLDIECGTYLGDEVEEKLAHYQGWLLLQFVHHAQRFKIYK